MINLLLLLLWGGLLAVGLSLLVLVLAAASRLMTRHGGAHRRLAAVARLWPLAAAVVVLASLLVLAGLAATSASLVANINPATCSADGGQSTSQPPKALLTAQDYLAQGAHDFDRGNCNAAIVDFSHAIELNPNLAEAYNSRAYTYMIKQQYALALPDLDRALRIRPDYLNALMNRGDIYNYYYTIDYDRAIADYDRVLRLQGAGHSSVCGHRMLAVNHGWSPVLYAEVLTAFATGSEPGCGGASPGY